MKRIILLLLIPFIGLSIHAKSNLLNEIVRGKYNPKVVKPAVSSFDGEFFYQADALSSCIIKYSYKTGNAVDTIFNIKRARECTLTHFDGFLMSPDEKRLLLFNNKEKIYRHSFKADYYYYDIRRNLVQKLTNKEEKQTAPVFSKDGRMLAYVCNNNIWLVKFDYGTETQITKNGLKNKIINGATDWVYEEEFGVTTLMDFSFDNKLLAFIQFDESEVSEFSFQKYDQKLYPDLVSFKYPKSGMKNSKVTCQIFDIDSKTTHQVNLPSKNIEYLPRIEFVNNGDLAVMALNRNQKEFSLYMANPRTTIAKLILQEKNDKYISSELVNSIYFLDDEFVYLSERDGYSHIYAYSMLGIENKQLTSGKYDVTQILAVNPVSSTIYYQAAENSPLQRSIYKISTKKGNHKKISEKEGYNTAVFSANGKYLINNWSNISTPNLITIQDASGKTLRVLEDNKYLKDKISSLNSSKKEFFTVKGADETILNGWMLKPKNFDSNKKYPLLMVQYSGPNSQQVLDRFSFDWIDYLATQNYIVVAVDGRGTGARGEDFRKSTYRYLGIKESDDQIAVAKHLKKLDFVDPNNISIWGWSYGGYNVLMSLSRSTDVFKSGIAIAPVTDWRFYDTVYTERYMDTPQENPDGYLKSSALQLAQNLEGKLLLIHGSADDNVHFQNSIEYITTLIEANKQIDMFMFPDLDHSILGSQNRYYLYSKIIDFLNKN